jgi:hypothetical protein
MTASSSTDRTVERDSFGSVGGSATEVRFFYFATAQCGSGYDHGESANGRCRFPRAVRRAQGLVPQPARYASEFYTTVKAAYIQA